MKELKSTRLQFKNGKYAIGMTEVNNDGEIGLEILEREDINPLDSLERRLEHITEKLEKNRLPLVA
ncbi:MAG: hypothetical protein HN590_09085 [Calditrichaeota bacterium]|jgi:hypothetical protein|nr:hypothetical protein [Calditrichota bacterium]